MYDINCPNMYAKSDKWLVLYLHHSEEIALKSVLILTSSPTLGHEERKSQP